MTTPIRLELPTGFQFGTVNAYLFTDPEPVLVDTGLKSETSWAALQAGLARHGLTVADLARVVITHPHVDHCGQARQITRQSQAKIWIVDLGQPWLLNLPARLQARTAYYQDVFFPRWGFPPEVEQVLLKQLALVAQVCEAVPKNRLKTFRVGHTLQLGGLPWQVLHAPGHASTQTCFYQASTRQFLSADMLLAKTPAPVLEQPANDDAANTPALAQFLDSFVAVDALEINRVYPGHGEPFTDHRAVIQRQRARIQQRLEECFSLIAAGHRTVAALMGKMYPAQPHLTGLWMLVGYLHLLESEGRLKIQVENGVWHYHPK
jgi:glyoxylase-like metal-dependent hydrolase (beta-lactamase superfamily II)